MKLIYHDERIPATYDEVYERCQKGYGVKRPDRVSGFMGFFFRLSDVYAVGRLAKWAEDNPKVEEELNAFIRRYKAGDYGFVSRDEHDNNVENRWLCGSCIGVARYSFSDESLYHYGGIILEFDDEYGLFYSMDEDVNKLERPTKAYV